MNSELRTPSHRQRAATDCAAYGMRQLEQRREDKVVITAVDSGGRSALERFDPPHCQAKADVSAVATGSAEQLAIQRLD